jgi:hypothetical protein
MVKWMLVMVTIVDGAPVAENIDIFNGLAKCYVEKTKQEFKYDFKTLKRDWVCVRIEGHWDYLLRY